MDHPHGDVALYWPVGDADAEREAVERFVSPAFGPRT